MNAQRKEVTELKMSKFARTVLIPTATVLAFSGAAFADADINTTGPDSINKIVIDSHNELEVSNHNDVTVNNNNTQTATTGDASVNGNTTGGSALSGSATNENTTDTTISIDNQSAGSCCGVGGGGQGGGAGGGNVDGSSTTGGKGGGAGGGSGEGSGMLPVTGASSPIDVSALRQAFSPSSAQAPLDAAHRTSLTLLLALAAILGLSGAVGGAVYSAKRTLKV